MQSCRHILCRFKKLFYFPKKALVFEQAGAYCMTEGIALFLSRDLPGVVLCTPDGRAVLARDHLATHPLNTPNHQKEWNLWKD